MKCPPVSSASQRASITTFAGSSTRWHRPPWNSIWAIFSGEVEAGITAMNGNPSIRAKYASETAVEPEDASTTVVSRADPAVAEPVEEERPGQPVLQRAGGMHRLVLEVEVDPPLPGQREGQQVGVGGAVGVGLDRGDRLGHPRPAGLVAPVQMSHAGNVTSEVSSGPAATRRRCRRCPARPAARTTGVSASASRGSASRSRTWAPRQRGRLTTGPRPAGQPRGPRGHPLRASASTR